MPAEEELQRLVVKFAGEARSLCERATRELFVLERPEDATVAGRARDNLARHLHTLKGSAASLGLNDVREIAHRLETLMEGGGGELVESSTVDLALRALDTLLVRARAHASGNAGALGSTGPLLEELDQALARARAPGGPLPPPAAVPPAVPAPQEDPEDESWRVSHAHVTSLGGVSDRLREMRMRLDERRQEVRARLEGLGPTPLSAVEVRALLERVEQALGAGIGDAEVAADGLDDVLRSLSTLPVSTILESLQRAARDAARTTGKEVALSLVGGELLVDRRLLDELRGPLLHLVRNAVDHGLEPVEARAAAGKPRSGSVVIRAELRGGQLAIEVADDGAGLDYAAIRAAALERGVMGAAEVEVLPPEALVPLIFRPGFSTRKAASQLSGRGVGLDVVNTQVRRLDGQVSVRSDPGRGTWFHLILPSRAGSAPVLPLAVGEVVVGFPVTSLESVSRLVPSRLDHGSGAPRLPVDGELLPLQDLGGLLRLRHPVALDGQMLVMARHLGTRFALVVDETRQQHDFVIRPLPEEVRSLGAYRGMAMLASGALMPVLEPAWLAEAVSGKTLTIPEAPPRRALVVDDSLTARALHRAILEASGYQVHLAASGAQALEHLRHGPYDVVVCDLAMAEMDGAAFTRVLRASSEGERGVPVVVVSAHESEATRQRALSAGADAFLTKQECGAGRLAAEVEAAISRRKVT